MYTEVAAEDLLREVSAYDFGSDPAHENGANRIDAMVAFDRVQAAAKAGQLAQIAAFYAERCAQMRLGSGDPALSVIGEIAMARNISPIGCGDPVRLGGRVVAAAAGVHPAGDRSDQRGRGAGCGQRIRRPGC